MMNRNEYFENAFKLLNEGKISDEAYDAMIMNADSFCDEDEDAENNLKSFEEME